MLRSIWYLLKILSVVGVAVFLAVQPGTVEITWQDYTFRNIHLGAAAVVLFLCIITLVMITGFLHRLLSLPREYARYRKEKQRTKGYQALVRSLTAAASGDHKVAYYQAQRAQKLLPDAESGIPLLLQAHSAKSRGNIVSTDEAFRALLKDADTALLGVHGLMQKAVLEGDYPQALRLARDVQAAQPKNYTLLKPVYDLELRNRLWTNALATLSKATAKKVIPLEVAHHDMAAIYCILGDDAQKEGGHESALQFYKKAHKAESGFVPAIDRLARALLSKGQKRKALALVRAAWKKSPHCDLVPLWQLLAPSNAKEGKQSRYRWFEWVASFHPDLPCAALALARVAIDEGLWGEARAALVRAEKLEPTAQVYGLWVELEERTGNKPEIVRQWLDRAATSPHPAGWICTKTGRRFDHWIGVVEPEGLFNTLTWGRDLSAVRHISPVEIETPRWLPGQAVAS